MRSYIFFIMASIALPAYAIDLTFSCTGNIQEDFTFSKAINHYDTKDTIGLIVRDKELALVGSQNLEVPIIYGKNSGSNLSFDFTFPICAKKNHEIFANNYS